METKLTHARLLAALAGALSLIIIMACSPMAMSSKGTPTLAEELTVYGWEGYIPQAVLDAFTEEYGVPIRLLVYGDATEATMALRRGEVYDVVVLDNIEVEITAREQLLAELDHRNLPHFQQIANDFRDLAFDPKNKYSVPFEWGTSGLLFRSGSLTPEPTRWADLWNPAYTGKIGLWPYSRDVIGIALKSLGYSYSSEDPAELAEAEARLLELADRVFLIDPYHATAVPHLLNGDTEIIFGWAYDMQVDTAGIEKITYVVPEEGTVIWMDNLVIPATSPDKYTAELFLDFMMRPEIAAQISNEMYVAMPNQGAYPQIKPEVLNNPLIFPTAKDLADAEFYMPLRPEAQRIYDEIWTHFLAAIELNSTP